MIAVVQGTSMIMSIGLFEGDVGDYAVISAKFAEAAPGRLERQSGAVVRDAIVAARAATVDLVAGWDISISPAVTATLAPDIYVLEVIIEGPHRVAMPRRVFKIIRAIA